jgi:hypothetical protein
MLVMLVMGAVYTASRLDVEGVHHVGADGTTRG